MYYDTFDVFMNSQNPPTPIHTTNGCQDTCGSTDCIFESAQINRQGLFRLQPRDIGSTVSNDGNNPNGWGYYYVLDTTETFKPRSL